MSAARLRAAAAYGGLGVTLALSGLAVALYFATRSTSANLSGAPRVADVAVGAAAIAFSAVGTLVVLRGNGNPIGWIFLAMGPLIALTVFAQQFAVYALLVRSDPLRGGGTAAWLQTWSSASFLTYGLALVLLLFPDGQLLGPRWRPIAWGVPVGFGLFAAGWLLSPRHLDGPFASVQSPVAVAGADGVAVRLQEIGWFTSLVVMLAGVAALVLRYRRARGVEREQVKWLAFAGAALAFAFLASALLLNVSRVGEALAASAVVIAQIGVPVSAGVAILRYRLYDIDVVVNRSLVYGSLTALLAGAYFGLVLLLQLALSPVTKGSGLAVALSTLAVAALFRPARARVQALVDRRFYRRKYDAQRTLEGFAARLREEVDLDALHAELTGVVAETMQPAHVSLWLRGGDGAVTTAVTISERSVGTKEPR